jgi:hypothetical protein
MKLIKGLAIYTIIYLSIAFLSVTISPVNELAIIASLITYPPILVMSILVLRLKKNN